MGTKNGKKTWWLIKYGDKEVREDSMVPYLRWRVVVMGDVCHPEKLGMD